MKIVALDLGTSLGVAHWDGVFARTQTVELASEKNLRTARRLRMDRRLDPRAIRFTLFLTEICQSQHKPDYFVFEDVRFVRSTAQAHLWGTFRGIVWAVATLNGIEVECLDTAKLKKYATGSGSADKDQMAAALIKNHPGKYAAKNGLVEVCWNGTLLDDNAVDALHLLDWAMKTLNK